MTVQVDIRSEITDLELVVTHQPDSEFERMLPENLERYRPGEDGSIQANPDYLLFDDLVDLRALREEHAELVGILRAVVGHRNQVDFRELLASALAEPQARKEAIDGVLYMDEVLYGVGDAQRHSSRQVMECMDGTRLASALISGTEPHGSKTLLKWPAPNLLFARDLAAAVGDAVVLTYAAEPGRRRDMFLMRLVMRHHQLLRDVPTLDISDMGPMEDNQGRPVSIEGGDIQVLNERVVLVGVGLRTSMSAVERLASKLFVRGFENVLACSMPRRRAAMHIDTLFTRIDEERCLIYPPMVLDPKGVGIAITRLEPSGSSDMGCDLLAALANVGVRLEPVFCGGTDPTAQTREQWSDGANAFALAPGVVICYGRNEKTLGELNRVGYEIIDPPYFKANAKLYTDASAGTKRRVAIALMGHELVRGRGGPRCLTLPLRRCH